MRKLDWNRIAERLKMLEALQEAQRIEARNNADHSWVSSSEMRERMAKRGVNVGSPPLTPQRLALQALIEQNRRARGEL